MSIQSDLDELIVWYEKHKPGVKEIAARCTRKTARKFAKPATKGGPLVYHGFTILPVRVSRKEQRASAIHEQVSL